MKLTYTIDYASKNNYFLKFLNHLIENLQINAKTKQTDGKIYVSIDDTQESIEKLFSDFETKLPLSIFLGYSRVEESYVDFESEISNTEKVNLSLYQDDIMDLLNADSANYLNPFLKSDFFGYDIKSSGNQKISFYENDTIQSFDSNEELFRRVVLELKNGHPIKIATFFGTKTLSLKALTAAASQNIILSNTKQINLLFTISQKEFLAISSIERPRIAALINKDFDVNAVFTACSGANIRLPYCAMEFMLALFLNLEGIDYVFEYDKDICECEHSVKLEGVLPIEDPILEVMNIGEDIFITQGRRGVVPVDFESGCEIEDYEGAIYSVVCEYGLKDKKLASVYLSRNSKNSSFSAYKEGVGVRKFIEFSEVSLDVSTIFQAIASTASGEKLMHNFANRFPIDSFSTVMIKSTKIDTLAEIFGVFGLFCGFEGENLQEVFENLNAASLGYEDQRSVKIDMKMDKVEGKYIFNYLKTIQSIMSFKLADVSKEMLSYALFESFADFINDNLNEICKQNETNEAVITGDFFANKMVAKRVQKHATNLYKIYRNIALPMDGVNIIYGCECVKKS